jgi:hypothetical protein
MTTAQFRAPSTATEGGGIVMPSVQGLSKAQANYRKAENPKFRCQECKFMFPRLSIGGCRFVRGVIHADDTCDEFKPRDAGGS